MSPIDKILSLLKGARKSGKTNGITCWMASCPAHEDRQRSLSVRHFPDDSVSVKCFAGCNTPAVLGALGLSLADLFPRSDANHPPAHSEPSPSWRDLIAYLREDLTAMEIAAVRMAMGEPMTVESLDRVCLAVLRIRELLDHATPRPSRHARYDRSE